MKTYIFGNKKPDTDSVMSSIALSYLENKTGNNTEARVLGTINKESIYALKHFLLSVLDCLGLFSCQCAISVSYRIYCGIFIDAVTSTA